MGENVGLGKKSTGIIEHPFYEAEFAEQINGASISAGDETDQNESLVSGMKSLFVQSESKQDRGNLSVDVLIIDNNIFFALSIMNYLKQRGLSYDHVQDG